MRVLWIHPYFATPAGWGSVRTYEFARRWVAHGHQVDVLCSGAYDPSLRQRHGETIDGVRLHVARSQYRPQMGFVRRVMAFASFMLASVAFVLRHARSYDCLIVSSGPLTNAIPGWVAHRLTHKPFVFEVIDVWPDAAIAAGVLRNPMLKRLAWGLERAAYRHASAVVTCSDAMTARVVGKGVAPSKVTTISNSCDVPPPGDRPAVRRAHQADDGQMVVVYTGAMGRSNAIADLVACIRLTAADPRIAWWLAGDGPAADELRRAGSNVRFLGSLPHRELIACLAGADAAVVTFMHDPFFHENSPNKFFDAIAAGLPVVFNRSTWLEPWLEQYDCGVACKGPDRGREMADVLKRWADDPGRRRRMGEGARKLAHEVFSRDRLAQIYLEVLRSAAEGALFLNDPTAPLPEADWPENLR